MERAFGNSSGAPEGALGPEAPDTPWFAAIRYLIGRLINPLRATPEFRQIDEFIRAERVMSLSDRSLASLLVILLGMGAADAAEFEGGLLPLDHLTLPDGPARGVAFLFSDMTGWAAPDDRLAEALRSEGIATLGVDLPGYLQRLEGLPDRCVYLIADIERMAHEIGRATGAAQYPAPILAGTGAAGGLALTLMVQTPAATIGGTVVTDPTVSVPLRKRLCSPAPWTQTGEGPVYDVSALTLVNPVDIGLTDQASPEQRARSGAVAARDPDAVVVTDPAPPGPDGLRDRILAMVDRMSSAVDALPLVDLPTRPTHDTMAIVLSGDGGWRDIDKSIAESLRGNGVPTVGLDALRYFWRKRTPEETATDLATIINAYARDWEVRHVALIGFSFGANVLPDSYLALDPATQAKVSLVSLLSLSSRADWEITVSGWLGSQGADATPVAPGLARLPAGLVQCIHGTQDRESLCPDLAGRGMEVVGLPGGHHFNGDYDRVAAEILAGLDRRR